MTSSSRQERYPLTSKEAFEMVQKARGYEERPDGLYRDGQKVDLNKVDPLKITDKATARLVQELKEHDLFRTKSLERAGHKVMI